MKGKTAVRILYFGDFDPSGSDMFRDIKDRLVRIWGFRNRRAVFRTFTVETKLEDGTVKEEIKKVRFDFTIERVAVNEDQLVTYPDLPSKPTDAKTLEKLEQDTRTRKFIEKHGGLYATELDALPIYIEDEFKKMVVDSVNRYFDQEIYNREIKDHVEEHSEEAIRNLVKTKVNEFSREFDPSNPD